MDIYFDENEWEESGSDNDRTSRLTAHIYINGVPHHVSAYAVEVKDSVQIAADPYFQDQVNGMAQIDLGDGHWQTVEIKDRNYVIAMTPFC